jgi:hypothetical protein
VDSTDASAHYATASGLTPMSAEPASGRSDGQDLEALIMDVPWKVHCPDCCKVSHIRGPFDLDRFRCPECKAVLYPFVEMEGRHVDLRRLRTFLINLYYKEAVANEVLIALGVPGTAAKALELDLPPRLILGHALASLLAHIDAECEQPYAHLLMGLIFPLLPWAFRVYNRHELRDALRHVAVSGAFGRHCFDPAILPFKDRLGAARHLPRLERLLTLFHVEAVADSVYTTDHDGYAESLGEGAHDWSLAIDRRRKIVGAVSEARYVADWGAVQTTDFCRAVVQRAMMPMQGVVQRSLDLQIGGPEGAFMVRRVGSDAESKSSVCAKEAKLIEMVDHRRGCIFRTVIHVTSSRQMIGLDWQVFQRVPSGALFRSRGKLISAEAELCRDEIIKKRGSRWDVELQRTATDLGPPLAALMSWLLWVILLSLFGPNGYLCLVAVLFTGALRAHFRRCFPLPSLFGDEGRHGLMPSYLGFGRAVRAARVVEIGRIAQLWGQADSASRPSLTAVFMSSASQGAIASDEIRFLAWVQNEQLANGVVAAARARGIDMDESEKRILEIVNYGVIAHNVIGDANVHAKAPPTAAGGRQSSQKNARRGNARASSEDHRS